MSVGGYDVECVDEISKDFYCIICLKLMRNAIQMNCGHGMCRTCFDEMIVSYQQRNVAPECPSCRSNVTAGEVVSCSMIDRVISSLKVMCYAYSDGCEWIGELSSTETHNLECNYRKVTCPISGCNEIIQYCKIPEHMKDDCRCFEHDCLFKEFGCNEKMKNVDKYLHEGDTNHLMLFQQLLKEKDAEIEKLKKENVSLKEKLASIEDIKSKIDDVHAMMKCKQVSENDTAVNSETEISKCLPSVSLNDSNIILDEIKNKCNLVDDLNDEKLIHDSIITHQFLKFESLGRSGTKQNLVGSLHQAFEKQIACFEKERCTGEFFKRIGALCNNLDFLSEKEVENYFTKQYQIEHSVCNLRIHIMQIFFQQIMYIKAKGIVLNDLKPVSKIGKYFYVYILGNRDAFTLKGTENKIKFKSDLTEFHTYSIKEVRICNQDNCIELEPTVLLKETFDDQKKKELRVFFIKRRLYHSTFQNSFFYHNGIILRLLME